ncbi:uncharacterized protein LOC142353710 [Convolutriloba macropyga]|uniref:uncharacterized protein LOC142353710 n=1 Tax=Convolutriloba macropyga TaxID=536237 RepID=UPI003F524472
MGSTTSHNQNQQNGSKPHLIVIGCNIGGMYIIRRLLSTKEWKNFSKITFIDKNDYIEWFQDLKVYITQPDETDFYLWKTGEYFQKHELESKNMEFVHAEVTNVVSSGYDKGGQIHFQNFSGESQIMDYNFLVICSGVQYGNPIKSDFRKWEQRKEELLNWNNKIVESESVVVLGGGAVGVELAGEISCQFSKTQNDQNLTKSGSKVHLVTRGAQLLDRLPENAGQYMLESLARSKVEVHLRSEVNDLKHKVNLDEETTLFLPEITKPGSSFLQNEQFKDSLDSKGGVKVNKFMQVENFQNVFAFGDCCNTGLNEEKGIPAVIQFGDTLFNNLCKLVHGKSRLQAIPKYPEVMQIIPSGPNDGIIILNYSLMTRGKTANTIHNLFINTIHNIGELIRRDKIIPWVLSITGFISKILWFAPISSRYRARKLREREMNSQKQN